MGKLKIVTILGARPQFIKAAAVSSLFKENFDEILVHTGQHYDSNMSDVFFQELEIPKPKYQLNIGSGSHGAMTGAMLIAIEKVLIEEKPDFVLVYGDTNSTLAGALAASKMLIPVIHVEAGLRSFNKTMPEEQNRILTDHVSELLFAPTQTAIQNLQNEGIKKGLHLVGDVMYDGILHFTEIAKKKSTIIQDLNLLEKQFILCTIHRAENTNDMNRLQSIFNGLNAVNEKIVLPLHPRTLKYVQEYGISIGEHILIIEPIGYLDMVRLESAAKKIVTDSGGVQKEAFFLKIPCITLRDETEWVETVQDGWNILVGANEKHIQEAILTFNPTTIPTNSFGDGNSVHRMIEWIKQYQLS
ncbi:non-hydrolyzing UDP-N-acetylglucosamine 2-epimerase [Fluviicola taffensis]|uniref:UDP-N-acetylglucosamine 2-epimerase n=1 Tax=Fluviicola taffensis (strain DSM 16823 / NCIMB 13979 / RW262) TaxID=755732 RepID=F2IA17_FLUTR|nr:UDP-N-acetylglucosamine 2-epimerase (non-hydrolyzing) [Fluviicola taffensis]AEA44175.1 UDP-N-acetylglucosamine 2-epimerase [Fluviicola taffensis DSM 16823]